MCGSQRSLAIHESDSELLFSRSVVSSPSSQKALWDVATYHLGLDVTLGKVRITSKKLLSAAAKLSARVLSIPPSSSSFD